MLAGSETLVAGLMARVQGAARSRYRGATLGDLAPFTGSELADEVEQHPPFGRLQLEPAPLIRAGLTTAAVPRPTPIAWTRADLDLDAELGARALARAGLTARARSSDCLDGGLVTPGTLAVADALDALDALALPVGPLTSAAALRRAAEVWEIVQPRVLICDAASYRFLADSDGGPRPDAFAVLLTPDDVAALAAAPRSEVYRILSVPQVATFVAGECTAHAGYHLATDAVLAELIDGSGHAVRAGVGRLLLTTLLRSLALLRFDSGLDAAFDPEPCRCGDPYPRLRFDVG